VNLLHEEIDKRQSTRAALLNDYKSGIISKEEYVGALQQSQRDAKSNQEMAREYAKILKSQVKNEKLSVELFNVSETETELIRGKGRK